MLCIITYLIIVPCPWLTTLKNNNIFLGNLLDELSRAVLRVDNSEPMPQILIDEYLVKAELTEDQENEGKSY